MRCIACPDYGGRCVFWRKTKRPEQRYDFIENTLRKTVPYELSAGRYFRILLEQRARRVLLLYLLMVLVVFTLPRDETFAFAFAVFLIGYPLLTVLVLFWWTHQRANQIYYGRRTMAFDQYELISEHENGFKMHVPVSMIDRVVQRKSYWLLYLSAGQFIYVDRAAFASVEDRQAFTDILGQGP